MKKVTEIPITGLKKLFILLTIRRKKLAAKKWV